MREEEIEEGGWREEEKQERIAYRYDLAIHDQHSHHKCHHPSRSLLLNIFLKKN